MSNNKKSDSLAIVLYLLIFAPVFAFSAISSCQTTPTGSTGVDGAGPPGTAHVFEDDGTDANRCDVLQAMMCGIGSVCFEVDTAVCVEKISCAGVEVESAHFQRCASALDNYSCGADMPSACDGVFILTAPRSSPASPPPKTYDL